MRARWQDNPDDEDHGRAEDYQYDHDWCSRCGRDAFEDVRQDHNGEWVCSRCWTVRDEELEEADDD